MEFLLEHGLQGERVGSFDELGHRLDESILVVDEESERLTLALHAYRELVWRIIKSNRAINKSFQQKAIESKLTKSGRVVEIDPFAKRLIEVALGLLSALPREKVNKLAAFKQNCKTCRCHFTCALTSGLVLNRSMRFTTSTFMLDKRSDNV